MKHRLNGPTKMLEVEVSYSIIKYRCAMNVYNPEGISRGAGAQSHDTNAPFPFGTFPSLINIMDRSLKNMILI